MIPKTCRTKKGSKLPVVGKEIMTSVENLLNKNGTSYQPYLTEWMTS